jgi:hypothetical protein
VYTVISCVYGYDRREFWRYIAQPTCMRSGASLGTARLSIRSAEKGGKCLFEKERLLRQVQVWHATVIDAHRERMSRICMKWSRLGGKIQ